MVDFREKNFCAIPRLRQFRRAPGDALLKFAVERVDLIARRAKVVGVAREDEGGAA